MVLHEHNQKRYPARGLKNRSAHKILAVFPRGSKKRKSNDDGKNDHGQEIRRPSTLC